MPWPAKIIDYRDVVRCGWYKYGWSIWVTAVPIVHILVERMPVAIVHPFSHYCDILEITKSYFECTITPTSTHTHIFMLKWWYETAVSIIGSFQVEATGDCGFPGKRLVMWSCGVFAIISTILTKTSFSGDSRRHDYYSEKYIRLLQCFPLLSIATAKYILVVIRPDVNITWLCRHQQDVNRLSVTQH